MGRKVTIVGAGDVGSTVAQRIVERELAEVVVVDVLDGLPQGKALDLQEACPIEGIDNRIVGANGYDATANSDVIVMTAGVARRPGMTREDLLNTNSAVVRACVRSAAQVSPQAVLIVVSNPLDAMCHAALSASGFPRQRVIGMAGVLDSARMRAFIALELGVSVANVHALVLGGHGDTMVPLVRYATVAGVPVTELLPPERLAAIVARTANGGAEIVSLLKTGSAYYAPAAATVEMVEAVLKDQHKILPCSAHLQGEYGIHGAFVGVPVQLGAPGIERVWEIPLTEEERAALGKAAVAVRELVAALRV